jgi:hypothetical protein
MDTRAQALASIPWDGQRISVPGIYAGMPLVDYHRGDICDGPSISSSGLRLLWRKSPEHYWDSSPLNPLAERDDGDNHDFVLGRAVHHLVCGEAGFASMFIVRPNKAPDGKAWHGNNLSCQRWLERARAANKGVLKPDDVEVVKGMALALNRSPLVRAGILSGLIERSMFWKDRETGVWLKARPDVIPTASGDFADLKTTQSVLYPDLQSSLHTYGYVQQGALVLEGAQALDIPANSFTLVWVEKSRPYCVDSSTLIDEDIARGIGMNRVALRKFKRCWVNKEWPGPSEGRADAAYLQLTDRARAYIDERLQIEMKEAA